MTNSSKSTTKGQTHGLKMRCGDIRPRRSKLGGRRVQRVCLTGDVNFTTIKKKKHTGFLGNGNPSGGGSSDRGRPLTKRPPRPRRRGPERRGDPPLPSPGEADPRDALNCDCAKRQGLREFIRQLQRAGAGIPRRRDDPVCLLGACMHADEHPLIF